MPDPLTNYGTVLLCLWFLALGYALGWVVYG